MEMVRFLKEKKQGKILTKNKTIAFLNKHNY